MKQVMQGVLCLMLSLGGTGAMAQPGEIAPGNAEERASSPAAPSATERGWQSGESGTHGAPGSLTGTETGMLGKHSMTGTVQNIDRQKGFVSLNTDHGPLKLHFPPGTLQKLKKGDRIQVNLSFTPVQTTPAQGGS